MADQMDIDKIIAAAKLGVFLGNNDIQRLVAHYEAIIDRIKGVAQDMATADRDQLLLPFAQIDGGNIH